MAGESKPRSEPQAAAVETAVENRSILDRIAEEGRIGQSPEERTSGKVWLKDLVQAPGPTRRLSKVCHARSTSAAGASVPMASSA